MADLTGMGVRWPLGTVGLSGSTAGGGFGGMMEGATKLLVGGLAMREKQHEADAKAKAAEAQKDATLKQAAALGAFQRGVELLKTPNLPAATQAKIYNDTLRPSVEALGFALPEVTPEEWRPDFTKHAEQFNAVMNLRVPMAEKQAMLEPLWSQLAADPRTAPIIQRQQEQVKAQRQGEVSQLADLTYRVLAGDASPEETTRLAVLRAQASSPDSADDLPAVIEAKTDLGIKLAEAHQLAFKRRHDTFQAVGKDMRGFERDPATGALKEVVQAERQGPTLSQPLRDALAADGFDVRTLDPAQPKDAAIIARTRRQLDDDARTKTVKDAEAMIPVEVKKKRQLEGVKSHEAAEGTITGLRTSFTAAAKDFITVRDAYARVEASAKDPSPAGDLSLIYNYMKILDPTSVVRESEFAQAAQAGSFGDRIQAAVGKVLTGKRLEDGMRKDFVDRAGRLFDTQRDSHGKLEDEFGRIARQRGVNPTDVIIDYVGPRRAKGASAASGGGDPLGIRR